MPQIEIIIGGQKFLLKGEDSEDHLKDVAELVKRKIESIKKKSPGLTFQKATMLAAFDFASDAIKGKKKATDYRSAILSKANSLLEKVQAELEHT
jgi:cell division protein ZapA